MPTSVPECAVVSVSKRDGRMILGLFCSHEGVNVELDISETTAEKIADVLDVSLGR